MTAWMKVALEHIGTKEIKGPKHSSTIVGWLNRLGAWWDSDEVPWCGVYVAAVMALSGIPYPRLYMRAKEWLSWGKKISVPVYGCVVVFGRTGGGHVGFVVGLDKSGNLLVLGGNQNDEVNVRAFPVSRVLGYRIPTGFEYRLAKALRTYENGDVPLSRSEA